MLAPPSGSSSLISPSMSMVPSPLNTHRASLAQLTLSVEDTKIDNNTAIMLTGETRVKHRILSQIQLSHQEFTTVLTTQI